MPIQPPQDGPEAVPLQHPGKDVPDNRGFRLINLADALRFVTAIPIEFQAKIGQPARKDARPLVPQRSLADLLMLDFRRIALHIGNELPFRGIVQRFGHKRDRHMMMLRLAHHYAEMHGVPAQPVNGMDNHRRHRPLSHRRPEACQMRPVP